MRIGFVGLGNIGKPMAERLARAPFELTVFDASEPALTPFAERARVAKSIIELGREVQQVGICVRHDADVTAVVGGPGGLLDSLQPGSIVAIHSTVRPVTVRSLASLGQDRGVHVLDAAVSGGPLAAVEGKLVTMVGGEHGPVSRLRPVLDAFSKSVIHAGATGMGMTLKLCNNLITYVQLQAAMEGFRLALAAGLDEAMLREVLAVNGGLTPAIDQYLNACRTGPGKLGREAYLKAKESTAELAEKDLDFALAFATELDVPASAAEAVRHSIRSALIGR